MQEINELRLEMGSARAFISRSKRVMSELAKIECTQYSLLKRALATNHHEHLGPFLLKRRCIESRLSGYRVLVA